MGTRIASYYYNHNDILGEGSSAKVIQGHLIGKKQPRAMKIIDFSSSSPNQMNQIQNEVRILAYLTEKFPDTKNSPFLHLYDVLKNGDNLIIVTDLVVGEELDIFCTRFVSGVPEAIAKGIFYKVLCAVNILHQQDICHLDLKLENIMYCENNCIKLLDFGFSQKIRKKRGTEKKINSFCGSLHYVPPEVIHNIPYEGSKSDIWSLGIMLFAMLANQFPFDIYEDDNQNHTVFTKICQNEPVMPNHLSTGAHSVLKSMLQTDPSNRPTVEQLLQHSWFRESDQ